MEVRETEQKNEESECELKSQKVALILQSFNQIVVVVVYIMDLISLGFLKMF